MSYETFADLSKHSNNVLLAELVKNLPQNLAARVLDAEDFQTAREIQEKSPGRKVVVDQIDFDTYRKQMQTIEDSTWRGEIQCYYGDVFERLNDESMRDFGLLYLDLMGNQIKGVQKRILSDKLHEMPEGSYFAITLTRRQRKGGRKATHRIGEIKAFLTRRHLRIREIKNCSYRREGCQSMQFAVFRKS